MPQKFNSKLLTRKSVQESQRQSSSSEDPSLYTPIAMVNRIASLQWTISQHLSMQTHSKILTTLANIIETFGVMNLIWVDLQKTPHEMFIGMEYLPGYITEKVKNRPKEETEIGLERAAVGHQSELFWLVGRYEQVEFRDESEAGVEERKMFMRLLERLSEELSQVAEFRRKERVPKTRVAHRIWLEALKEQGFVASPEDGEE